MFLKNEHDSNERRLSDFPISPMNTGTSVLRCTACDKLLDPPLIPVVLHPTISVPLCLNCENICSCIDSECCLICNNGGELFICDNCEGSICSSCLDSFDLCEVVRNSQSWNCLKCDPSPLAPKKNELDHFLTLNFPSIIVEDIPSCELVIDDEGHTACKVINCTRCRAIESVISSLTLVEDAIAEAQHQLESTDSLKQSILEEFNLPSTELSKFDNVGEDDDANLDENVHRARMEYEIYCEMWDEKLEMLHLHQTQLQSSLEELDINTTSFYHELRKFDEGVEDLEAYELMMKDAEKTMNHRIDFDEKRRLDLGNEEYERRYDIDLDDVSSVEDIQEERGDFGSISSCHKNSKKQILLAEKFEEFQLSAREDRPIKMTRVIDVDDCKEELVNATKRGERAPKRKRQSTSYSKRPRKAVSSYSPSSISSMEHPVREIVIDIDDELDEAKENDNKHNETLQDDMVNVQQDDLVDDTVGGGEDLAPKNSGVETDEMVETREDEVKDEMVETREDEVKDEMVETREDECHQSITKACQALLTKSMGIRIGKLLRKILDHPDQQKYRYLRLSNEKISNMWSHQDTNALMVELGFREIRHGTICYLPPGQSYFDLVSFASNFLRTESDRILNLPTIEESNQLVKVESQKESSLFSENQFTESQFMNYSDQENENSLNESSIIENLSKERQEKKCEGNDHGLLLDPNDDELIDNVKPFNDIDDNLPNGEPPSLHEANEDDESKKIHDPVKEGEIDDYNAEISCRAHLLELHSIGENALVSNHSKVWYHSTFVDSTDMLVYFKCINENSKVIKISLVYSELTSRVQWSKGRGCVKHSLSSCTSSSLMRVPLIDKKHQLSEDNLSNIEPIDEQRNDQDNKGDDLNCDKDNNDVQRVEDYSGEEKHDDDDDEEDDEEEDDDDDDGKTDDNESEKFINLSEARAKYNISASSPLAMLLLTSTSQRNIGDHSKVKKEVPVNSKINIDNQKDNNVRSRENHEINNENDTRLVNDNETDNENDKRQAIDNENDKRQVNDTDNENDKRQVNDNDDTDSENGKRQVNDNGDTDNENDKRQVNDNDDTDNENDKRQVNDNGDTDNENDKKRVNDNDDTDNENDKRQVNDNEYTDNENDKRQPIDNDDTDSENDNSQPIDNDDTDSENDEENGQLDLLEGTVNGICAHDDRVDKVRWLKVRGKSKAKTNDSRKRDRCSTHEEDKLNTEEMGDDYDDDDTEDVGDEEEDDDDDNEGDEKDEEECNAENDLNGKKSRSSIISIDSSPLVLVRSHKKKNKKTKKRRNLFPEQLTDNSDFEKADVLNMESSNEEAEDHEAMNERAIENEGLIDIDEERMTPLSKNTEYACLICKKNEDINNLVLCDGYDDLKNRRRTCSHTYHLLCLPEEQRPEEDDTEWRCQTCHKRNNMIYIDESDDGSNDDDDEGDDTEEEEVFIVSPSKVIKKKNSNDYALDQKPETVTGASKREKERLIIVKLTAKRGGRKNKKAKLCETNIEDDVSKMKANPTLLNGHEGDNNQVHMDETLFNGSIKPHQLAGLQFLYSHIVVSLSYLREGKPGFGCVLAHSMGLGKSLQVVAFIHTIISNPSIKAALKSAENPQRLDRVLIITPAITIANWENEFDKWCRGKVNCKLISAEMTSYERLSTLDNWNCRGGAIIISYELFVSLMKEDGQRGRKSNLTVHELLCSIGPDVLICDEGHRLKNSKSKTYLAIDQIRTCRRVILTGTPIQNNLKELHCLVNFVRPYILNHAKRFKNSFTKIIEQGQTKDSTPLDIRRCKQRMAVLHKQLQYIVHRRDANLLASQLPPKHEVILYIKQTHHQAMLYQNVLALNGDKRKVLVAFQRLSSIWSHAYVMKALREKAIKENTLKQQKLLKKTSSSFSSTNSFSASSLSSSTSLPSTNPMNPLNESNFRIPSPDNLEEVFSGSEENIDTWLSDPVLQPCFAIDSNVSGKTAVLLSILLIAKANNEKCLVFSDKLDFLTLMQKLVALELGWSMSEWSRLDGSMDAKEKKHNIKKFETYNKCSCMFASLRAANVGINLVAATRVILVDQSWNPANDVQAIFRAYRFGQLKPVFVYRLVAAGTMEEKIFNRQVTKVALSHGVSDDDQQTRKFNAAEISDIFDTSQLVVLDEGCVGQTSAKVNNDDNDVSPSSTAQLPLAEDDEGSVSLSTNQFSTDLEISAPGTSSSIQSKSHDEVNSATTGPNNADFIPFSQCSIGGDEIELTEEDMLNGEREFEAEAQLEQKSGGLPPDLHLGSAVPNIVHQMRPQNSMGPLPSIDPRMQANGVQQVSSQNPDPPPRQLNPSYHSGGPNQLLPQNSDMLRGPSQTDPRYHMPTPTANLNAPKFLLGSNFVHQTPQYSNGPPQMNLSYHSGVPNIVYQQPPQNPGATVGPPQMNLSYHSRVPNNGYQQPSLNPGAPMPVGPPHPSYHPGVPNNVYQQPSPNPAAPMTVGPPQMNPSYGGPNSSHHVPPQNPSGSMYQLGATMP